MKDWEHKLSVDFDKRIDFLSQWRNEDHEDTIVLHRNDVVIILEGLKLLKEFLVRITMQNVGVNMLDTVELLYALKMLYDEDFEYETKNNLGNGHGRYVMRFARDVMLKAGVPLDLV